MNSPFERLLIRLDLEQGDDDVWIGGAGGGGVTQDDRLFGGLVAAQATVAVQRSAPEFPLHSLHAYFLRPGRPDADIEFHVTRTKLGKNFQVRSLDAWQHGQRIFQMQASLQRLESGVHHQDAMPEAPQPESLPNRDQLRGRANWQAMPIDVRMATSLDDDQPQPPEQLVWMRANGAVPNDPALHQALVVYASDRTLLATAWRPHADRGPMRGASLDHSMWFHEVPKFNDWLLYSMHSPAANAGRGLAMGAMYSAEGRRVASVAQEGVTRAG